MASYIYYRPPPGATSYIDGEVDVHANLPVAPGVPVVDSAYLVRQPSGVWLVNRKPAGIYIRTANGGTLADWTYAGAFPDVFNDANFRIVDDADGSKQVAFDVGGVVGVRTLTIPNKNGTIATTDDVGATSWGAITGTLSSQTDLNNALGGKQDALVSGTNLKTVNGSSLLGSGDLTISASFTTQTLAATGALAADTDVLVCSGAGYVVTLPASPTKSASVVNNTTGKLVLTPAGADTIEGGATFTLYPNERATISRSGTDWNLL